MMNERGKSDPAVVAMKLANKAERSVAEPVEPRAGTKGNANQQHSGRTQSRETVSQVLVRIRQTARNSDLPSLTRGRSRMRESRTYGSVRGAGSNLRPLYVANCLADEQILPSSEENGEPLSSL